ncbi:hypothetical protein [Nocardioides pakistanensis]
MTDRRARMLPAALLGAGLTGCYLGVWQVYVEQDPCESTAMLGCIGRGLQMYLVGLPVLYLLWALGMRLLGVALPWLAPLAVALALLVLAEPAQWLDLDLWVWPVLLGAVNAGWVRLAGLRAQRTVAT